MADPRRRRRVSAPFSSAGRSLPMTYPPPITLSTATPRTAPTHGMTRVADTCHSERASPRASRRIPTGTDARTSRRAPALLRGTLRLRSLGGCSAQGDVVFIIGSERVLRATSMLPRGYDGRPFLQVRSKFRGLLLVTVRHKPRIGASEARRYKGSSASCSAHVSWAMARSSKRSTPTGLARAKFRTKPGRRRYKERTAVVAAGNNLPIARSGLYAIGRC